LYNVRIYHLAPGFSDKPVDEETFPIGSFSEIGYWLDYCGYIDAQYRISIIIT
jgi:hypothetical protein